MSDYKWFREKIAEVLFRTEGQTWEFVDDEELIPFTNAFKGKLVKPFKLYRYSSSDYWNLRNFETQIIKLSPVGKLNDIYEGIPNCDLDKVDQTDLEQMHDIAYLKCFTENPLSLLMWSHYADEYHGICIEYDLSLLPKISKCLDYLFPVSYTNKRYLKNNLNLMKDDFKKLQIDILQNGSSDEYFWLRDISSLFLVKGDEWKYEKEWRIIVTKLQMAENALLKNETIQFECTTAIYLGVRTPKAIKENIMEIVNRINAKRYKMNKIKIYQTMLHSTEYKLEAKEI